MNECDMLVEARRRFIVGLDLWSTGLNESIDEVVVGSPLSSQEAIGELDRDDFPLLRGKEVLMQAVYRGAAGQAFTSVSGCFKGTLGDVLELPLTGSFRRAVLVSTMNAVLRNFGLIEKTVHCKDDGPEMRSLHGGVDKRAGFRHGWARGHAACTSGSSGPNPGSRENHGLGPGRGRISTLWCEGAGRHGFVGNVRALPAHFDDRICSCERDY